MADMGIKRELSESYDAVLERLPAALSAEGFGVLTRIDMKETMKQKLGVEFPRYQILGACNPPLAHRALTADRQVGLLLPCNVVIYEDAPGRTTVLAIDPVGTLGAGHGPELEAVATEVKARLTRAVASL